MVSFCWSRNDWGIFGSLTAFRDQTGYALAQLSLLGSAFSASYLVVRGVAWDKVIAFVGYPAPILLAILILMTGRTLNYLGFFPVMMYILY